MPSSGVAIPETGDISPLSPLTCVTMAPLARPLNIDRWQSVWSTCWELVSAANARAT